MPLPTAPTVKAGPAHTQKCSIRSASFSVISCRSNRVAIAAAPAGYPPTNAISTGAPQQPGRRKSSAVGRRPAALHSALCKNVPHSTKNGKSDGMMTELHSAIPRDAPAAAAEG